MVAELHNINITTSLSNRCNKKKKKLWRQITPLLANKGQDLMIMQFFHKPSYLLKLIKFLSYINEPRGPNMHNPKTWQLQMQISNVMWWWVQQSEIRKIKNKNEQE